MSRITLQQAADAIGRMVREHPNHTAQIMRDHGAMIVTRAGVLTPVDTGYMIGRNEYLVSVNPRRIALVLQNKAEYAVYQHNKQFHHPKPTARDHFLSIPFEAELPAIITAIVDADIEEATRT